MFEGVQDQFHQFLAAAAATPPIRASPNSLPLPPLSFSLLHGSSSSSSSSSSSPNSFPIFDPYPPLPPPQPPTHHHILQQQLHLQFPSSKLGGVKQEGESIGGFLSTSLLLERERTMAPDSIDPWSNDEVLALLRIRSAMENWFPEFTWEHVSRKLAEFGFKRSPQKCKEKFEEESRYLHSTTSIADDSCPTKNYRLFSELEELYHHGHDPSLPPPSDHHHQQQNLIPRDGCEKQNEVALDKQNPQGKEQEPENDDHGDDEEQLGGEGQDKMGQERLLEENDCPGAIDHHQIVDRIDEVVEETKMPRKKSSRDNQMNNKKFEIFKCFCEEIVNKIMAQQEELHNKILQNVIKRHEEKIAREEAWKKQEIERINKEIEARAQDQAIVRERQSKIIEFLEQFTSTSSTINNNDDNDALIKAPKASGFAPSYNPTSSNTPIFSTHQNPSSSATPSTPTHIPTSSNDESFSQTSNPSAKTSKNKPNPRKPRPNKRPYNDINDTGKRWPRDEVLALINIRCSIDIANNTGPEDRTSNGNHSNTKNPPLWERISQRMTKLGYKRSAKRCKEKWENINKYFRKTKDTNKKRSVDSRTCPYFHQLSHLYSQGRVMGGAHGGAGGGTANDGGGQGEDHNVVQVTTSTCDFGF